jgi:vitamin B12 transporter
MNQLLIVAALFCALSLPFTANADTPMELMIVTPARMTQALDTTITDTTVLDAQQIRDSGAADVPTLLRTLGGVEVTQSGGLGNVSSTFMRGTNSDHVLVLLDGVRINSATSGTTALEHIMLDNIERIEVVRGNVSSLYGSEAIGGVIQLFTKQGHGPPAFNASGGLGSHGTLRLAAGYSGSTDANSYSVNAGTVKTDGLSAINTAIAPNANPDNDGYDNVNFDVQVKHTFNSDHQLAATLFSTYGDSKYDDAYGVPTEVNSTKVALEKYSLVSDDQFNDLWHSKLRWARGIDDSKDYLDGMENGRIKTVNYQLGWQNELRFDDKQRVSLAAERLVQSVDSDIQYSQTERTVNSLLGGYLGEYGAQQVQLNLRQDRYSDFGTENTGLVGYGWSFADKWRVTASISNAFKAPTFNDMYAPALWGSNPDLLPERSINHEIGLRYVSGVHQAGLVLFNNRIYDLIVYQNLVLMNIEQARIYGAELNYTGEFGDTSLYANATMQNPRDTTTGELLLRRAESFVNLGVTRQFGKWESGAGWKYSGKREDFDINPPYARTTLASYSLVNLSASYMLSKQLKLSLRADNLFDKSYMLVDGYNTPGRTLFAGLNYQQ